MPAHYRNFHNSVPWLILFLEVVFFVIFYFSDYDRDVSSISYPDFQDVNHMVIFGFGFFLTFLKRYRFSSTGFNLLIIVLGVQCSVVIEELLLFLPDWEREDDMRRIVKASLSLTAVIISIGAVLGKTNPVQLSLMTVVEMVAFHMTRWMHTRFLQISDNISMMHVHLFGAYFGLAAASRFSEPLPGSEKNASTPKSDLLSMLGTVFLWVFWPSFNSVIGENKIKAISNTYFALAVSTVTAFMLSALITKDGKFKMTHIHSAVLAGGVAVGYAAHSIKYPWIAMILGLLASVITILGSYCLPRCLNPVLKIHDTSGVHFTFGLPSMLGALAHVVLLVIENWTNIPRLCYLVMIYIWAFFLTMDVALITGFITGFILNLKLFKTIPVSKYFEDQFYWEFPHLAVGY
ncbi:blood group Rh(CE) polypeptide [Athene cunicularia]|uniref:Rh blood group CcEe antigens n=1 Tax=Athene cunicularia TaxID=194338 RepID=A0A663N8G6_ATHCN|nr:blood group Rh(CE) polypeptide [Athene cunicularia]XP_026719197.1 blood group Rh(CE) polypeptide [Athene cunicularia]